ncbi:MAG: DUF501 domain-containing protein [Bifidobacteriaceae bacterium]|jgi:hypothetical protein|nr:DUF501 domain-containing protein [Bifidobacteriaceae bacterium]
MPHLELGLPAAALDADRTRPELTDSDLQTVAAQLGRPPRGLVAVAARCVCGAPLVVVTKPLLEDGTPFPTVFYLTQPAAISAVGRLESTGLMARFNADLAEDQGLREAYLEAHRDYLAQRAQLGSPPQLDGVSAGGMPRRVKCLHVLVAHSLARGPGVNPLGDLVLAALVPDWRPDQCQCEHYEPPVKAAPGPANGRRQDSAEQPAAAGPRPEVSTGGDRPAERVV